MAALMLKPWQGPAIERALAAPGQRWVFCDETGLGKTVQCLETIRRMGVERVLVIAPALARRTWALEVEKFGLPYSTGIIFANPAGKSLSKAVRTRLENSLLASMRIVSPELLSVERERAFLTGGKSAVVLDEFHYYTTATSERSRTVESILHAFDGPVLAATATPITNRIVGLWSMLNILCPGRYGFKTTKHPVPFQFLETYAERVFNGNNWVWGGLRPDRADHLKERLTHVSSRTTKKEVRLRWPGTLPSCQIRALALDGTRSANSVSAAVAAWAKDAIEEVAHVAILTNLRATAETLAAELAAANPGLFVLHVDGGTPAEIRRDKIEALRRAPAGVLVSTMHAVKESIPLTWCHRALIAELYWRPATLVQLVGRFPRIGGDADIIIDVLCGADTVQARMALAIAEKIADHNRVMPEGAAEESLLGALGAPNMEDELLNAATNAAAGWEVDLPQEED